MKTYNVIYSITTYFGLILGTLRVANLNKDELKQGLAKAAETSPDLVHILEMVETFENE